MKSIIIVFFAALLSACSNPTFVGDAEPIIVTSQTPEHFELPARFAFARTIYGTTQAASVEESALWAELAGRAESLGSFTPLVVGVPHRSWRGVENLIEAAREQRFNYLILVQMHPSTGSADILLYHVGSGGVMATVQAISRLGGKRGFWGGRIRNPARLERIMLAISQVAVPSVEEMLRGAALRQD